MVEKFILVGLLATIVSGCNNTNQKIIDRQARDSSSGQESSISNSGKPNSQDRISSEETETWNKYINTNYHVSFSYPPDWVVSPEDQSLHFKVNGIDYRFRLYMGYGIEVDSQNYEQRTIGEYSFLRTEYMKDNRIILVTYSPIGITFGGSADGIEAEVPEINADHYLHLFDAIMNTVQIM